MQKPIQQKENIASNFYTHSTILPSLESQQWPNNGGYCRATNIMIKWPSFMVYHLITLQLFGLMKAQIDASQHIC